MSARKNPASRRGRDSAEDAVAPSADATRDPAGMFSAASFGAVVAHYDSRRDWTVSAELPQCPVVAFYGFRGGAGRTTALAHVAALLASRQHKIVAVDLDVEAPGLHDVLDCPPIEKGRGVVALLRSAATSDDPQTDLRLAPHLLRSKQDIGGNLLVLPAGRLDDEYLSGLDDLGVPLWHLADGPSPLGELIDRIRSELAPDAILVDCRTGLSGLSASAIFHLSNIVVCLATVSKQSLDGLSLLFQAIKASKLERFGQPEVLVVPSMVPDSSDGRARVEDWFIPEIEKRYREIVGIGAVDEQLPTADEIASLESPVVREGIEYRRGIALNDYLRADQLQSFAGNYLPLLRRLDTLMGLSRPSESYTISSQSVLDELSHSNSGLDSLAFAESTSAADIVSKFIEPTDFRAIIDRSTSYVVGGKGAGKTWLWTYLLSKPHSEGDNITYIAAHGPSGKVFLSPKSMLELDRDKQFKRHAQHGAFWLLYGAWQVFREFKQMAGKIAPTFSANERKLVTRLASAEHAQLLPTLREAMEYDYVSSFSETLIKNIDQQLLDSNRSICLLYDGLDVGFGSDEKSLDARKRFVLALVESIEPFRGALKRVFFKVFLREDIFADLDLQNQSHLKAATQELHWEPRDLWILTLNILAASPSYMNIVQSLEPQAGPGMWPSDDERRRRLLVPFWGEQMERGRKVTTSVFIERRTADGKSRLFPRTLVQLISAAVKHQTTIETSNDRVLRSAAILAGFDVASKRRVDDLLKEYEALTNYLGALKGMNPTGTVATITRHIARRMPKKRKAGMGAEAGALHAGPGGWRKVVERLLEVGVLREYRRARGERGEQKYEVALLYRPGLGIKAGGV